ncbi:MAG: thioredoxin family protein [Dechloromonas sp.]|nr:MAG: thioredoxin family protein [Dechloromonas sp.]
MTYIPAYAVDAPKRAEIDALPGLVLLEFGVDWCPHCQGAQPAIEAALRDYPALRHIKVEDGPGRRLGCSFRVKLWPTLILMKDGQELGRVVRPTAVGDLGELMALAA